MPTPQLLMCPPDHFAVVYAINPWMDPDGWAAHDSEYHHNAEGQWQALHDTFEQLGAEIRIVPPGEGWPDMVFTANAGIWLDGRVLLARFRYPERTGEEPLFDAYFRTLMDEGLVREVGFFPEGVIQEGEGDCLWDATRGLFWSGYGQRSEEAASTVIAEFFGCEVVPLHLVNPRYYHLDVSMCPLPSGHIMACLEAFSPESVTRLTERAGADWIIPVSTEDADRMALNAVVLGQTIVLNDCSADLEARLTAVGYSVRRVPLPAFLKSGGSACCLSMRLDNNAPAS